MRSFRKWAIATAPTIFKTKCGFEEACMTEGCEAGLTADDADLVDFWSGRPGSNRRRPAWEAGILPLNYSRSSRLILLCQKVYHSAPVRSPQVAQRARYRLFERPSRWLIRWQVMKSYRKELWFEVPTRRAF